jgi:hypothetical protein
MPDFHGTWGTRCERDRGSGYGDWLRSCAVSHLEFISGSATSSGATPPRHSSSAFVMDDFFRDFAAHCNVLRLAIVHWRRNASWPGEFCRQRHAPRPCAAERGSAGTQGYSALASCACLPLYAFEPRAAQVHATRTVYFEASQESFFSLEERLQISKYFHQFGGVSAACRWRKPTL